MAVAIMLTACGGKTERVVGIDGKDGVSCFVTDTEDGVLITCADSTGVILDGRVGDDGEDGNSCTAEGFEDGALISCEDGSEVFIPGYDDSRHDHGQNHDHDDHDDDDEEDDD